MLTGESAAKTFIAAIGVGYLTLCSTLLGLALGAL